MQIFVFLILVTFIGLFIMLSIPMKDAEATLSDNPKTQPTRPRLDS